MTDTRHVKLKPGDTIGILGGGQLGRMLAMAAARLGLRATAVLEELFARTPGLEADFWADRNSEACVWRWRPESVEGRMLGPVATVPPVAVTFMREAIRDNRRALGLTPDRPGPGGIAAGRAALETTKAADGGETKNQ